MTRLGPQFHLGFNEGRNGLALCTLHPDTHIDVCTHMHTCTHHMHRYKIHKIHIYLHTNLHAHMSLYAHMCPHILIHIRTHKTHVYIYIDTGTHVRRHTEAHAHRSPHKHHIHVHIDTRHWCICVHTYPQTHTCTYPLIDTGTHKYHRYTYSTHAQPLVGCGLWSI